MATKEFENWDERVIQKNNTGSYTVTLPVNIVRNLRWQQGQRVLVKQKGKTLLIKDAPKR